MALNETGFPSKYFAPYVDVTLFPPFPLAQTAQNIGTKFYTLAFIVDGGSCTAAWGGTTPLGEQNLLSDISNLRSLGGDVIVSFGGASGKELAQACSDVSSLQAQYQAVIDMYSLTQIDFDIEGAAVGEPTSIERRNQAIAGLQAAAQTAGKQLIVSYTLPVEPSGLDFNGLNVLQNAIQNGVNVNVVNIMTMDYGGGVPPDQMGSNATQAANSLFGQLQGLFPSRDRNQLWSMIGVTPMIGVNDVQPEVFTLQDAQQVLTFAQQNNIGRLAMWSAGRDQPCPGGPGGPAQPTCSGIEQQPFDFSKTFNQFTG